MAYQKVDWNKFAVEQESRHEIYFGTKQPQISLNYNETIITKGKDDDSSDWTAAPSLLSEVIKKGVVNNNYIVQVQRQNPNSPLYSARTFEALNLNFNLLKGVYDLGYNSPSRIQETALPTLLADPPQNLIAQSQSGTGKTAAFVLAMLSRVDASKKYPQVLCISPTYELAIQIGEDAARMAKYCPEIEMKFAVRGEQISRGAKLSEHIVIGTPGKILDWALKYRAFDLGKLTVFVLDEADTMISVQGHRDQCIRIHKHVDRGCQMMFFSATYDQEIIDFAEIIVPRPIIIRLRREEECLDNIQQYYVRCANHHVKYNALTNIYGTIGVGQAIIFCRTRVTANWLAEKMSKDGHAVAVLNSDLTAEQRLNVLDRFRIGSEKVLITTNVLSRGIDVEQVTIVVNFDLPVDVTNGKADCDTYLHRIGRTGRFGKRGIAINLVETQEDMDRLEAIERHFNRKIEFLDADDSEEIGKIGV